MTCIFCKIVKKEIPAEIVFEDEKVLAFLDINPVNPGHTLVIPKEHYPMMGDTPDELISAVYISGKKIMKAIKKAFAADFVAVAVVGIDVPHFHAHLIPRYFNDGLANFWPHKKYGEGEMKETGKKIKNQIQKNNFEF